MKSVHGALLDAEKYTALMHQDEPRPGDPKFYDLLEELAALHAKKNKDYGRKHDPYANVRGSQEWGVSPWVGAMVRANDKMKRLQVYAQTGTLANEGVEDSLLDLAVYVMIALLLRREEVGSAPAR